MKAEKLKNNTGGVSLALFVLKMSPLGQGLLCNLGVYLPGRFLVQAFTEAQNCDGYEYDDKTTQDSQFEGKLLQARSAQNDTTN